MLGSPYRLSRAPLFAKATFCLFKKVCSFTRLVLASVLNYCNFCLFRFSYLLYIQHRAGNNRFNEQEEIKSLLTVVMYLLLLLTTILFYYFFLVTIISSADYIISILFFIIIIYIVIIIKI